MQLRVASGEPLSLTQNEVAFNGHAIEVRLCAEDARLSFMPQSGTLARWRAPENLRVEHALYSGTEIAPYYDSMIAKIISHGATREEARRMLVGGLGDTVALGVTTNQTFLSRCLAHPVFVSGGATTAFIADNSASLFDIDAEIEARASAIAAMLLRMSAGDCAFNECESRLLHSFPVPVRFEVNGKPHIATLTANKQHRYAVVIGKQTFALKLTDIGAETVRFICDGVADRAIFHRAGTHLAFQYAGWSFLIDDRTLAASTRQGDNSSDGKLRASMNGRVVAVLVVAGDSVDVGQPMIVVEAMKMEHVHRAPVAGRVSLIRVVVGEQVAARRVIAEVEASIS